MDRIEQGLIRGLQVLKEELGRVLLSKEDFIKKLSGVVLYRIEVPNHTDLNRYFEIMNTRGEQLEQHDILKANLMSFLNSEKDKSCFATIWDACSDMTGYVQMHFVSKNNNVRNRLFGAHWNEMPICEWEYMLSIITCNERNYGDSTIKEISKIKLRIMSDLTRPKGDVPASLDWKNSQYKEHEESMIRVLKKACGIWNDDKE